MAWPLTTIHDQTVELSINGAWTDITSYVIRDGVQVSRGRSSEGSTTSPATMQITLNNRDYRFSPRNTAGAYYPYIGRNTKIRHSVRLGQPRLRLQGGDQFSTPDSAAISVTGDIDLRVDLTLPTWRPGSSGILGLVKGNSYTLLLATNGAVTIGWYEATVYKAMTSTIMSNVLGGR